MALIKSKTLESGIAGDYWVVTCVSVRFDMPQTDIYIGLWLDAQAFNDGKQPVHTSVFQIRDDDLNAAYFAHAVLQEAGKSVATQAQAYLHNEVEWFADAAVDTVYL